MRYFIDLFRPELDLAVDMNASMTSLITLTADNMNDRNQPPTIKGFSLLSDMKEFID